MIRFNIASFNDSTGSHGFARDTVAAALVVVGDTLSSLLSSPNGATVDLQVNVLANTSAAAATGGSAYISPSNFNFNGLNVIRSAVGEKITTGIDINGATADGTLTIYSSFIDSLGLNWSSSPVANGIVSVLLHEMTHAMGMTSSRDRTTGAIPAVAGVAYRFETPFDTFVELQNGAPMFTGATARQVYGAPLPLAALGGPSSISHISPAANTGGGAGRDLMNPSANIIDGAVWTESDIDLAILRDLGYSLAKTLVSRDGHTFFVGAGAQNVAGTTGTDTAVLAAARSDFTVASAAGAITLASRSTPSSTAFLSSVERLQFTDKKLAFDANALSTAKVLGAVFGKAAVANTGYAGIGLGLLDGGTSYVDLMKLALAAKLGAGASNEAVVTLLYTDLVGVAPGAGDLGFYSGLISSGQLTQAQLGVVAADHPLNAVNINLVGMAATGLEFA